MCFCREVEAFITANSVELSKDKWLCPLSGKKFKGPEFVRKHVLGKHADKLEEVSREVQYFNNYLLDPQRPAPPQPSDQELKKARLHVNLSVSIVLILQGPPSLMSQPAALPDFRRAPPGGDYGRVLPPPGRGGQPPCKSDSDKDQPNNAIIQLNTTVTTGFWGLRWPDLCLSSGAHNARNY